MRKMLFCLSFSLLVFCPMVAVALPIEWSDITPMEGIYSKLYFDYNSATFYVLNDWAVNQDDGGINGGLKADEYNRFNFSIGSTQYEIRIFRDGSGQVITSGDPLTNFESATGWATSPNWNIKHTIWEFQFDLPPAVIAGLTVGDPKGGGTPVFIFSPLGPVVTGPSPYPHVTDGIFTEFTVPEPIPIPLRDFQDPAPDPWFPKGGFNITLLEGGGVKIVPVPEPSTLILVGFGVITLLSFPRKNKRKKM